MLIFPVPLAYSDIGRGHMVRASLEAAAYAIRANVEQIEELADVRTSSITVGGGMTRTTTWTRILTDVLGRSIGMSPTTQTSSLGAYLCARTALGDYGSLAEASQSVRPHIRTIDPDARNAAEYEDHYARWLEMSGRLGGLDL